MTLWGVMGCYCAHLKGVGALIAFINIIKCKPHYHKDLQLYKTGQPLPNNRVALGD